MPQRAHFAPIRIRPAGALALFCGMALGAMSGSTVQWQLEAKVPVMCTILDVNTVAGEPTDLAISTSCNTERYQLILQRAGTQVRLRAARSSAGPVQINKGVLTITSTRPGQALTTVELAADASMEAVSISLHPFR